jgi:hypothetical protein
MFYSSAHQDKFVYNILHKNNNGYFIDIGSSEPIFENNSYFLESVGWNGICIETEKLNYSSRKCNYINFNAVELCHKYLFLEYKVPKIIDYLFKDNKDGFIPIICISGEGNCIFVNKKST